MLDGGADVRYVAEMLGHQKLETTMIRAGLADQAVRCSRRVPPGGERHPHNVALRHHPLNRTATSYMRDLSPDSEQTRWSASNAAERP